MIITPDTYLNVPRMNIGVQYDPRLPVFPGLDHHWLATPPTPPTNQTQVVCTILLLVINLSLTKYLKQAAFARGILSVGGGSQSHSSHI